MFRRFFFTVIRKRTDSLSFNRGLRGRMVQNVKTETRQSVTSEGLLCDFKTVDTSIQLAEMLKKSGSSVTGRELIAALTKLSQLQKSDGVDEQSLRVACNHIVKFSRFLDLDELVSCFKYLTQLKVTSQSVVMQTVLQLIRKDVNELSFGQIFFLDFLLKEVLQTPLVTSLRSSLPLVVRNQLDIQMNRSDLSKLLSLLEFCSKNRFHPMDLVKVATSIERHFPLPLEGARVVLWAVPSLGTNLEPFQALVKHSVDVVSNNIAKMDVRGLLKLLERLLGRGFYSERLLSALSSKAINEHWDLIAIHSLLKLFSNIGYIDHDLLDEYFRTISKEMHSVDISFNEVVAHFATANYIPSGLEYVLIQVFRRQEPKFTNDGELLKLALALEILDCKSLDVGIDLVLGDEQRMLRTVQYYQETNDWEFFRIVLQLVSSKKQQVSEEISSSVLDLWRNHLNSKVQDVDISFSAALKHVLGNEPHQIHDAILTRSGVFIDHVIVFSSDPPVGNNEEKDSKEISIFEEVIRNTEETDLIIVLLRECKHFAINCDYVLGPFAFERTILRNQRLKVLEISLPQWNEMPDWERLPFLSQRINETRKIVG